MAMITKKLRKIDRNPDNFEMMYYMALYEIHVKVVKPFVLTKSIYEQVLINKSTVMIPDPMDYICWFELDNLREQKNSLKNKSLES